MNTSEELNSLVTGCVFPRSDARDLPRVLARIAAILDGEQLPFVIAGRVAQAQYCRAQFTDIIEFRVERRDDVGLILSRLRFEVAGLRSGTSTVNLRTGVIGDVEQRWMARSLRVLWLETNVPIATPEHLLLLALLSRRLSAEVDAIDLFASGHVDWDLFREVVIGDRTIMERAARARRRAKKQATSSFSASMERYLALVGS